LPLPEGLRSILASVGPEWDLSYEFEAKAIRIPSHDSQRTIEWDLGYEFIQ